MIRAFPFIRKVAGMARFGRLRLRSVLASALCGVMSAACGSGNASLGTSAFPPPGNAQGLSVARIGSPPDVAYATVIFSIGIARKGVAGRTGPRYVSPSSRSLQILTDGANPVIVDLQTPSPHCLPNPAVPGAYYCQASFTVLPGNHVFSVTIYDASGAAGNILSTNSTGVVYVEPTGVTRVSIVLDGVVKRAVLLLATTDPPAGKAAAIGLTVLLEDADRNLIVGPAPFNDPVMLTTTDAVNGPLSKTRLNSPADEAYITANYNGANVARITYAASAAGLPAAQVFGADLTPNAPVGPQHLYATTNTATVIAFDLSDPSSAPATFTGGGLYTTWGVAADSRGLLYVSDANRSRVSVFDGAYPFDALVPLTGGGISIPAGLAFDRSGKLYVTELLSNSVLVFDTAHGDAVLPAVTGGGLQYPEWDAVDDRGKLYVTGGNPSQVLVFDTAHGNAALAPISGGGLNEPAGLAVDANGKLYVANLGSANAGPSISVFDTLHGNAALAPITRRGLNGPEDVAVDAIGRLYVGNYGSNVISVFDTRNGDAVLPPITSPLGGTFGVAVH